MSDDSVDDFLEHYGIPGMKWGRRKGNTDDSEPKREKRVLTREEKARRNEKIKAGIGLGLAGAVYFAPQILSLMNKSYGSLLTAADNKNAGRAKAAKATADAIIRGVGKYPITSLSQGPDGRWGL